MPSGNDRGNFLQSRQIPNATQRVYRYPPDDRAVIVSSTLRRSKWRQSPVADETAPRLHAAAWWQLCPPSTLPARTASAVSR